MHTSVPNWGPGSPGGLFQFGGSPFSIFPVKERVKTKSHSSTSYYLPRGIIWVMDSIPWVGCASGNVFIATLHWFLKPKHIVQTLWWNPKTEFCFPSNKQAFMIIKYIISYYYSFLKEMFHEPLPTPTLPIIWEDERVVEVLLAGIFFRVVMGAGPMMLSSHQRKGVRAKLRRGRALQIDWLIDWAVQKRASQC